MSKTLVKKSVLTVLSTVLSLTAAQAGEPSVAAPKDLSRIETRYMSPNQVEESCVALAKLPLGDYKKNDVKEEKELCGINFYNDTVALCPKTWSTSPGTIINSLEGVNKTSIDAENSMCSKGSNLDSVGKFKQTMNQSDTSGTFAGSSIMYYHMSRALDTIVDVPVAVMRTMDKDAHYARVSAKANPPSNAKMNVAGWNWIKNGEKNPDSYRPTSDLFTADKKQIYGVILNDRGERYGAEVNGTRASGWGKGQNFDFQKTPGFAALKSSAGALQEAIKSGLESALKDTAMAKAFSSGRPSDVQMVLWMNEISEIAVLDFIFSQQDRIGNIDYRWFWVYNENGEAKSEKVDPNFKDTSRASMNKIPVPAELVDKNPTLVQKTMIGDNDAGGLPNYANFTRTTGMLDGVAGQTGPIKHLNKELYQRLLKLKRDFQTKGENYQTLAKEVKLIGYNDVGDKRFAQLINNTIQAATIFENNCNTGVLKLDLVSFKSAVKGDFQAEETNCALEE